MELGGNKWAGEYYKKHNMFKGGQPDHEHPALGAYKAMLTAEVMKEIGTEEVVAPVKVVE